MLNGLSELPLDIRVRVDPSEVVQGVGFTGGWLFRGQVLGCCIQVPENFHYDRNIHYVFLYNCEKFYFLRY